MRNKQLNFRNGDVIDVYSRFNVKGGINGCIGTLTTNAQTYRKCGTFWVVEEIDRHRETEKR